MSRITIVGLGAGDIRQLPLGIYEELTGASKVYLRTEKHPVVEELKSRGIPVLSFDHLYERESGFEEVYEAIAAELTRLCLDEGDVLFAVPGHPMVAERTTQLLLELAPKKGIELEIGGGQSFLDAVFSAAAFDPVEGFCLLDGLNLQRGDLNPHMHLLITQVYDQITASDVKLTLMEVYPDEYPVVFITAAGVQGMQRVETVPLYELDHFQGTHNLAVVYVPKVEDDQEQVFNRQFSRLREIITILRSPGGCPWDREQTHQSIRKHLIEEAYEVLETIDADDPEAMCEELGDLLMQVMLHSQIAEDEGDFTVEDVIAVLNEKLIRRHPHVFGEQSAETSDQVVKTWEAVKSEEKKGKGIVIESLLAGIPKDLPAVMTAYKLQKKASQVGFDWGRAKDILAKVEEEMEEVKTAADQQERLEELGDLLFVVVNLARFMKVDPEEALAKANLKFKRRFGHIEQRLKEKGIPISDASLEIMEGFWQEAKQIEKGEKEKHETR